MAIEHPHPSSEDTSEQYQWLATQFLAGQREHSARCPDAFRTRFYQELEQGFPLQGKKVLDAGCGAGEDLLALIQRGADAHGLDASEAMLAEARRRLHRALPTLSAARLDERLHQGRFEQRLPFSFGFFDGAISRFALHHAIDLDAAYRELHRVIRPCGVLGLMLPHPWLGVGQTARRDYRQEAVVETTLFDGRCTVRDPARPLDRILTPTLLNLFNLRHFHEGQPCELQETSTGGSEFIFLKLVRR